MLIFLILSEKYSFSKMNDNHEMNFTGADHLLEARLLRKPQVVHALHLHAVDTGKTNRNVHVDRGVQHIWLILHRLTIKDGVKDEGLT